MPKRSAGLLPYRRPAGGGLELFLVHPGGPFWVNRDDGWWSIPKGEYDDEEDPADAAEREFLEETGTKLAPGPRIELGEIRQSGGKIVKAWAVHAPALAADSVVSNSFEMEWPPRSGERQSFPEIDRAGWFALAPARQKLLQGQREFIDRLVLALG